MKQKLRSLADWLMLKVSFFMSRFYSESSEKKLIFALEESARGWILETTCKHLSENIRSVSTEFAYDLNNLPQAQYFFFPHYFYFKNALKRNPHLWRSKSIVYFTHPREDLGVSFGELKSLLTKAHGICVLNHAYKDMLIGWGIEAERIRVIHFGVDQNKFPAHHRGTMKVGFSMAYYERKNPKKVVEIIEHMPELKFHLFGKGWKESPYWDKLSSFNNLEYSEPSYEKLPSCYQDLDVLVSTSTLEGGPTPILEALSSNVIPVCSSVGFAPDIIKDGLNGYLFSPHDSVDLIGNLINSALNLKNDVSPFASVGSWEHCTTEFERFI